MNEYFPLLQKSQLFSGISEQDFSAMLGCLESRVQYFPKDAYLIRAGEAVDCIGFMLDGSAWIIQEDYWGNRNILSRLTPGQSFAETFACVSCAVANVSVVADEPCRILFLNIHRVLTVCSSSCAHHSQIIRNLVADLAEKNMRIQAKLTHMAQRSTRDKLLSYLSAEAQRQGSNTFDIPFSRQELADYLAVERSGLSMALCKMRDEGLLLFHRNHFTLRTDAHIPHAT